VDIISTMAPKGAPMDWSISLVCIKSTLNIGSCGVLFYLIYSYIEDGSRK
jgi:hypothetical protein